MTEWLGIEELELAAAQRGRGLPKVPARLLDTVRRHGPINPVVVRRVGERRYEILDNAETWLAVQRLGRHEVPVYVLPDVDDQEAADIVGNAGRDADDPVLEAEDLARRLDALGGRSRWGATRRLAAITGLSRTYISHAVRLLRLPDEVQRLLRAGRLSVGHAKALLGLDDAAAQVRLARRIAAEGLTVRAAEALVRGGSAAASPLPPAEKDPDLLRLERTLGDTLGCPTTIRPGEGTLTLDYGGDLEVLDGLLRRLGVHDF